MQLLAASQKALLQRYAKQFEADGMFHKAANIYLSIHHVYDAINMLTNNSLFKYVLETFWNLLSWLNKSVETDVYVKLTVQRYITSVMISP